MVDRDEIRKDLEERLRNADENRESVENLRSLFARHTGYPRTKRSSLVPSSEFCESRTKEHEECEEQQDVIEELKVAAQSTRYEENYYYLYFQYEDLLNTLYVFCLVYFLPSHWA